MKVIAINTVDGRDLYEAFPDDVDNFNVGIVFDVSFRPESGEYISYEATVCTYRWIRDNLQKSYFRKGLIIIEEYSPSGIQESLEEIVKSLPIFDGDQYKNLSNYFLWEYGNK